MSVTKNIKENLGQWLIIILGLNHNLNKSVDVQPLYEWWLVTSFRVSWKAVSHLWTVKYVYNCVYIMLMVVIMVGQKSLDV